MKNTGHLTPPRPPGTTWRIGWLTGPSPLALSPDPSVRNPILIAQDVTDIRAAFVADPFLFRRDDRWHLVFEVLETETHRGVIGLATSPDARTWSYEGVILREPFHLSYPHVFADGPELFMTPETLEPAGVWLYRAEAIAGPWRPEAELIQGQWSDPTPFRHLGRWWRRFACELNWRHDTLRLFHAPELTGPWREHPCSPVVADDCRRARPAGRVVTWQGRLFRFAQDCFPAYGMAVRAFEILELTEATYVERPTAPEIVLAPGVEPWMSGVHHVDAQQVGPDRWVAAVDGTTPLA